MWVGIASFSDFTYVKAIVILEQENPESLLQRCLQWSPNHEVKEGQRVITSCFFEFFYLWGYYKRFSVLRSLKYFVLCLYNGG